MAVEPFPTRIARQAYREFGEGIGHPAKLDFGTLRLCPCQGQKLLLQLVGAHCGAI